MAEAPSILVIGPRWVGDMVMAQCLFVALKRRWPAAVIDVMAPEWASPLVERMPEVRARIDAPFERRKLGLAARWRVGRGLRGCYDRAYVLQGSWKSALVPFFAGIPRRIGHLREMRYGLLTDIVPLAPEEKRLTAANFRALSGSEDETARPHLITDAANRDRLLDEYALAEGGYVALIPGAEFGPAKRWPSRHYAALARDLLARGMQVALLGSANDADVTGEIAGLAPGTVDLAGRTRLADAIDLLAAARLAVTNDSGLMHVAAAVGTPVVAIYGSTSPDNTPPLTDRKALVWLGLDCSPCHARTCPLGHMNCLNELEPARVLAACERLMEPAGPR